MLLWGAQLVAAGDLLEHEPSSACGVAGRHLGERPPDVIAGYGVEHRYELSQGHGFTRGEKQAFEDRFEPFFFHEKFNPTVFLARLALSRRDLHALGSSPSSAASGPDPYEPTGFDSS